MSTLFVPALYDIESGDRDSRHSRYLEENAAATVKSASTQEKAIREHGPYRQSATKRMG